MRGCWKSFKGCSPRYSFSCPQRRCEKYLCSHSPWQLVEKRHHHAPHSRSQMHFSRIYDMDQVWLWSQLCFPSAKGHSCSRQHLCCDTAWWKAATPLSLLSPSSQKFHQERQPVWTSTRTAFSQSMLTIPITFWALECLANMLLSTSAFSILSVTTLTSLLFTTVFLPQILPSFFKVAHICRTTFVFLYDSWG